WAAPSQRCRPPPRAFPRASPQPAPRARQARVRKSSARHACGCSSKARTMIAMMRLLSWNVQSCRGMDGKVDAARTAAEARRLADPDIVCCQEIDSDALIHELPEYQSAWASGVDVPAGRGRYRFGNVILSRAPIGRILRHS